MKQYPPGRPRGESALALLRVHARQRPREGNRLPQMINPADPGHSALEAQPKARVRDRPVAPQIDVPLERLAWQPPLIEALEQ